MKEIDEWRRKHYGTKRCRIYRLADVYKTICIAYEKGTGIPFLNDPINTLHITDTSSLIGRVIIDVLNQTKVIDMPSAEYTKDWLYDNFKLKSFRTLDKKYSYCSVSLFEDELDIYLMKYDSRTKGPEEVEGKKVSLVFSATNESEIGDIIVSFFNESSSI